MVKDRFYLVFGGDFIGDAVAYASKTAAVSAFADAALELDRFGQRIEAGIHKAAKRSEIDEYPDYALSLGPRGGIRCEPC